MRKTITILTILFFSIPAFSQEEKLDRILDEFLFGTTINDSLLESLTVNDLDLNDLINTMYKYGFIYARTEFENKTFFSGQDIGIRQYNITGQVYYQGPKGLNIGIAGVMYSQFEPKYNTTILTAGYNNRIRGVKGLSVRGLYNRYFFAKVDSVKENAFNSSVDLGLTYQYKILGSSVDVSALMGNENTIAVNWDIYGDIPLKKFGINNQISFEPQISFYFGTETVVVNTYVNLPRFSGEISTSRKSFGLMNTTFRIPISLNIRNLDISAGYNFNIPFIPGSSNQPDNTSFFNLSLGYIFGI
jgi:hypothetical protein